MTGGSIGNRTYAAPNRFPNCLVSELVLCNAVHNAGTEAGILNYFNSWGYTQRFSTALPLSLEFEALRRMTARAYGVTVTLEPVVATLVGVVLLGQALPPNSLPAIALVTIAAIGVTLTDRRGDGTVLPA